MTPDEDLSGSIPDRDPDDCEMLLSFFRCRACGTPDPEVVEKVTKDVHGCVLQRAEWSSCHGCGLVRVVTPWTPGEGCQGQVLEADLGGELEDRT